MEEILHYIEPLTLMAIALIAMMIIPIVRKNKRRNRVVKLLGATIQELKNNPRKLQMLNGRYQSIYVDSDIRDRGREGGTYTMYNSYLVDKDDEIELLDCNPDDPSIEDDAQWLAKAIGIPFEYR